METTGSNVSFRSPIPLSKLFGGPRDVFADEYSKAQFNSTVRFHGSSLDRLYPILSEGLRICSGTSLQIHGAMHGDGIYMVGEPKNSWDYSRDAPSISGLKWTNLKAMKVLLGCEFAGMLVVRYLRIHVISDPGKLIEDTSSLCHQMRRYQWRRMLCTHRRVCLRT